GHSRKRLVRIFFDRPIYIVACEPQRVIGIAAPAVLVVVYIRPSETRIGQRIIGIEFERASEQFNRLFERFAVLGFPKEKLAGAKKVVVRVDIAGADVSEPRLFGGTER